MTDDPVRQTDDAEGGRTPKPMDRADFVFSIVLTAFGIGVLVESLRLPRLENLNVNPYTVPGIVPGILGVAIGLCGLALLIRSTVRGGWRLGAEGSRLIAGARGPVGRRVAVTLGLTFLYALGLFGSLPFWLATALFVFAFVIATEAMMPERRTTIWSVASALVLAVVCGVAVGFVFESLFYVRLPG